MDSGAAFFFVSAGFFLKAGSKIFFSFLVRPYLG